MTETALDYSAGRPTARSIKGAGHVGVIRYCGYPDRPKCVTKQEFVHLDTNGVAVALVHEGAATDWRGGFAAGQVNGRRGRDHANAIGFSADRPIYMAVDQDVVKTGEFATMVEYLKGANSTLGGPGLTGVYGEADVIDRARDAGVAAWFWQTSAWSRGRVAEDIHLFQKLGTVYVNGIACDVNDVLSDDWGQHNYQGDTVDYAQFKLFMDRWMEETIGGDDVEGRNFRDANFAGAAWAADAVRAANAARDAAVAGRDAVLNRIASIDPATGFTPEQVDALADRINAQLGGDYQLTITRTTA